MKKLIKRFSEKIKFENSKDPVKVIGRLFMLLTSVAIVFLLGLLFGIDPETFKYPNAVIYFAVIYILSYPIQILFEYWKVKRFPSAGSLMYSWNVELLIFIVFILSTPITGDLGAKL